MNQGKKVEVDPFEALEALERRTFGERYLKFAPQFVMFRRGYQYCLELLHHLGDRKPEDDCDRVLRDLACDTLDSLRVAQHALLGGYDNQCLVLLRRTVETTSLMSYFINYPAEVGRWLNQKRIAPASVRKALDGAKVREPEDHLREMYRVYSLFSHVNRETVFQRLLGEPNHFTIGAQGNSPEPAVGAVVRELLGQMMWFVDVSALAFIKVGSTLSEEYKARVLAYRYEVQDVVKELHPLFF